MVLVLLVGKVALSIGQEVEGHDPARGLMVVLEAAAGWPEETMQHFFFLYFLKCALDLAMLVHSIWLALMSQCELVLAAAKSRASVIGPSP